MNNVKHNQKVVVHAPFSSELKDADIIKPISEIDREVQMRINEQGEYMDKNIYIKGGQKPDL
jgi:hypothetical protein